MVYMLGLRGNPNRLFVHGQIPCIDKTRQVGKIADIHLVVWGRLLRRVPFNHGVLEGTVLFGTGRLVYRGQITDGSSIQRVIVSYR